MPQVNAPSWSHSRLAEDAAIAREEFREERMTEPLEDYSDHFQAARSTMETLLEETVDLSQLRLLAPDLMVDAARLEIIRYLAGPPISLDDLKTVSEVALSPFAIRRNPAEAIRAMETIQIGLDRNRFPWVSEAREPTEAERDASIVATAALVANRKVMTARANEGKTLQERKVKDALIAVGFREVTSRPIPTLVRAPNRGEFCGESPLGDRKADIIVRLWDDRVLAIECKVSNSATNSVKRLNNDAAVKAVHWVNSFGTAQMVPSAMLAGVFKIHNLEAAQNAGLTIWWSHNLDAMTDWIQSTR